MLSVPERDPDKVFNTIGDSVIAGSVPVCAKSFNVKNRVSIKRETRFILSGLSDIVVIFESRKLVKIKEYFLLINHI